MPDHNPLLAQDRLFTMGLKVLPSQRAVSDGLAGIGAISGGDCETMDNQPEVVWASQN
ncbi:MAG: hypothetical protein MUC60_01405 [Oscillatoria sp. Prado101]|jgi:hypothetical protein|nr:hypothetical protein [Oscillatoria sp. Prado101]